MKERIVLYPGMGMGHLVPAVELAKLFLRDGLAVTVLVIDPPLKRGSDDSFIAAAASAHPSLSFHHLPISLPPNPPTDPVILMFDIIHQGTAQLRAALTSLSETSSVRALVVGFFCTDALDVAAELGLPSYIFFATSAANLASFLYLPILQSATSGNFKDHGDAPVNIPGLWPIPASALPSQLQDRNDDCGKRFLFHFERLPRFDGILINTFESLEPRAVTALRDGVCLPGQPMTPTYCIGPLTGDGRGSGGREKHECVTWLDSQPKGSVVFLCFGSGGTFTAEQLEEMATGLERSGWRFLWVVRAPRNVGLLEPLPEPDLEAILPAGFLDRTKGRGLVVKPWAPQVEVLAHEAVGAFVTHCGWNSTLEGVCTGVPMIGWPLYAEQRMNKVMLVEMGLAVAVEGYDKGMVNAAELEAKVRWVMESEGGRELRKRATTMAAKAKEAWTDGGSSQAAWVEVLKDLKLGGNAARE